MKQLIYALAILLSFSLQAQNSISGTFSPAKDYTWLIAYRLKPGTQVYVADTQIKEGKFSLQLPENALPGTYRLVYAVPQEEFNFDIIYDGKEDIKLNFNTDEGVKFLTSKENILFNTYFKEINAIKSDLIAFYSDGSTDIEAYRNILSKYRDTQKDFEEKSKVLIANQFIVANKPYLPKDYETIQDYVQNAKASYFEHIDANNTTLQASGFLTDKLSTYIFSSLPLEQIEKAEIEKEIQKNISTVYQNLSNVSNNYSFHFFYSLWAQSNASGFQNTADFIFKNYIKTSPLAVTNPDIINEIEINQRLRIGAVAPEITWKENGVNKNLSALEAAENYVLVFWSSTCGHCLRELPALHKELKGYSNIKVVAVGLEEDDSSWKVESAKLNLFHHAIALGKWDSEYASLYDIHATPTYFILDSNKKIIAKPESDKEVIEFLKQ